MAFNTIGTSYNALNIYGNSNYTFCIKNTIIAQNRSSSNVQQSDYYRSGGNFSNNGYNIIEIQSGSDFVNGVNGCMVGVQDCLGLDNVLSMNSSSLNTPTLKLSSNSVAINAGADGVNCIVSVPTTDQRGVARVNATDIGAFEFTGIPVLPELTVNTSSLSGFNYIQGVGPSLSQSFTVSGVNLVNDVTVTASANYEVSNGGAFGSTVTLSQSGGDVEETIIYVRLKAGLSSGTRDGTVTVSTTCDSHTIVTTGSVSAVPASTRIWTGASSTNWNTGTNWSGSTVPTSAWHVIIPSSVTNFPVVNNTLASPATCNNLTINEGAQITISVNCGLTVSGNVVNNGNLYVKSSASGEGSLIMNGTNTGTGTDNVERYLTGNQWHLVSTPISNALAGVFEDIWLRAYNESTNTFGNYIQPPATPMPVGKGFSVWANLNDTRIYQGTINCGTLGPFSASLTGSAGPNTGWNLMGNPYTSAIDWDAASGWTKTNLANSVYIWNGTQYATYVGGVGTNGGSRYIPKGQGFFVQATASGASLSMNKNVQVHNSVSFMKNDEDPENTIRISVIANGYGDEAVIVIRESNSLAFDPQTDAYKFYGSAEAPQLVVKKDDDSELCIASLSSGTDLIDKTVLLYPAIDGQHTLTWSHNFTHDIPMLFDNFTQTFILPDTEYVFAANSSDLAERFMFKENVSNVEDLSHSINVWEYGNILHVSNNSNCEVQDVIIYNPQGQIVMHCKSDIADLNFLKPAIYIVKVVAGNNSIIEKIIIE